MLSGKSYNIAVISAKSICSWFSRGWRAILIGKNVEAPSIKKKKKKKKRERET